MLIVDGSFLLHRSMRQDVTMNSHSGLYTTAIHLFLTSLGKLLKDFNHKHPIIVAFDAGVPLFRREIYREYKPNKFPLTSDSEKYMSTVNLTPEEEVVEVDPSSQIYLQNFLSSRKILQSEILSSLGVLSIQIKDCEADDILFVLARALTNLDEEVILVSSDRDMLQLLSNHVRILNPNIKQGEQFSEKDTFIENFGLDKKLWKKEWLLYRAICGDGADGIPGVPHIGGVAPKPYAKTLAPKMTEKLTISLEDVMELERIPKTRVKGYESMKSQNAVDIINRNIRLMNMEEILDTDLFPRIVTETKAYISDLNGDMFNAKNILSKYELKRVASNLLNFISVYQKFDFDDLKVGMKKPIGRTI